MIWHFLEVWLLFGIVFAVGCVLGSMSYDALARSRLATAQGVVAGAVGNVVDAAKERFGVGPDWRSHHDPTAAQTVMPEPGGELFAVALPSPSAEEEAIAEEDRRGDAELLEGPPRNWTALLPPPEEEAEPTDGVPAPAVSWLEDEAAIMRPATLSAPRAGVADNLQLIRGIGRKNELMLHGLGIYHFGQIAAWTPAEARWVASHLPFPERIERDDWIGQAIILATGGDTGFHKTIERKMQAAWGEEEE